MDSQLSPLSIVRHLGNNRHTHYINLDKLVAYVMKLERLEAGMSMTDLAKHMECHISRLSGMETAAIGYPLHDVAGAARILGKNLQDIIDRVRKVGSDLDRDGVLTVYSDSETFGLVRFDVSKLPLPKELSKNQIIQQKL